VSKLLIYIIIITVQFKTCNINGPMKLIGQLASSCFISFSKLIFNIIVILSHLVSEFAFLLVVVAGELKLD